jgi:hypothetical protein
MSQLSQEHQDLLDRAYAVGVDTLGYTVPKARLDRLRETVEEAEQRAQAILGGSRKGPHNPAGYGSPDPEPTTAITHYVDKAMFEAEAVEEGALERPRIHLLSATPDPLGAVAAFAMMYEGRVVRDLSEITDEERVRYFDDCFNTALRTPLEAIDLHFMMEGITRATWDQAVRQRTAVFAGESLRFAVKEEIVNRPGPGVAGKRRVAIWEDAIQSIHEAYLALIADGVPAEDARGLLPLNVLTRGHYKTNLRNLEAEVGKRLCTQAQFEWRLLHADLRREIREFRGYRDIRHDGAFNEIKTEEWLADPTAAWVR